MTDPGEAPGVRAGVAACMLISARVGVALERGARRAREKRTMGQGERGHRQIEHTADLALELWAPTEAELYEEGARALVEIMTEGRVVSGTDERRVSIDALDRDDRLVQWLNEIIYLAISGGFLCAAAELSLRDDGLDAVLTGEAGAADAVRAELKSATYHGLVIEPQADGWFARVVIDV
jgi:SHS2 domain-containing protein